MAGLDPAVPTSIGGATDGRDKPGHDGVSAAHAALSQLLVGDLCLRYPSEL